MLGEKQRTEPMFYHIKVEEMIPENHLLRLVEKYVDSGFIRDKVKHLYSHTGRPSTKGLFFRYDQKNSVGLSSGA